MRMGWQCGVAGLGLILTGLVSAAGLPSLQPGQWYEVPGSDLLQVAPSPRPPGNIVNVMRAWSGGAFDSRRDRLLVWGGGHADYGGNELYAFSLASLSWQRLTDPSFLASNYDFAAHGWINGSDTYPDGRPASRHTYAGLAYLASPFDLLFANSGSVYRNGNSKRSTWLFDLASGSHAWHRKSPKPGTAYEGVVAAYDPVGRKVWVQSHYHLYSYDLATDRWQTRSAYLSSSGCGGSLPHYMNGAIDPDHRIFLLIGAGCAFYYDISGNGNLVRHQLGGTGDSSVKNGVAPGLAYDSQAGVFLAWNGGTSVYSIDLRGSTPVWTRHSGQGANPGAPAANGTYGRFQYSPASNLLVLVNDVASNVFLYRFSSGSGTGGASLPAPPAAPAKPSVQITPVIP